MFKFKFNTVRDQSKNSGKCGMYAMMFLHNILNGMSFKKASGYYDRDYENNENKLVKSFKFL
jgi:endonuclease YncB( thermonuclease family)